MDSYPHSPWLRGFLKVFALWAGLTSTPGLLLALNDFTSGRFSLVYLGQFVVLLGVAAVFGLIGATAMTVGVPARRKLAAIAVGVALGIALPLVIFWGLAAALPKNQRTIGHFPFL